MKQTLFFIAILAITSLSAQNLRLTTERNAYRAADKLVKQQDTIIYNQWPAPNTRLCSLAG